MSLFPLGIPHSAQRGTSGLFLAAERGRHPAFLKLEIEGAGRGGIGPWNPNDDSVDPFYQQLAKEPFNELSLK